MSHTGNVPAIPGLEQDFGLSRGLITPAMYAALTADAQVVANINLALAASYGASGRSMMFLCAQDIDDSLSIQAFIRAILMGHNGVMRHLKSLRTPNIMCATRRMNRPPNEAGFVPISLIPDSGMEDFSDFYGVTPLNRSSLELLGLVLAQANRLGRLCRSASLFISDSINNTTAQDNDLIPHIATVVRGMEAVGRHEVYGLGVGNESVFVDNYQAMGLQRQRIFTADGFTGLDRIFRQFALACARLALGSGRIAG
jgi:hypothetical protein